MLRPSLLLSGTLYFGHFLNMFSSSRPLNLYSMTILTLLIIKGLTRETDAQKIGSLRKGVAGIRYKISPLLISPHVELRIKRRTLRPHIWGLHYTEWS
jgi:hypothetical protein